MDADMIIWIVALIIAIVVEVVTMGLASIWFAGGALIALIVAALGGPFWLQVMCFVVVSVLLLLFTRPIAVKYFNKDRIKTNVDSVIGKQAIVTSQVDNLKGTGQVTVEGREWSARSQDDDLILNEGCIVKVMAVSGVKLICMPAAEQRAGNS